MKLEWNKTSTNGAGSVKLVPEKEEDMWHMYNLMAKGGLVSRITMRKVMHEMALRGRKVERVQLKMEVEVETVEYDKVALML